MSSTFSVGRSLFLSALGAVLALSISGVLPSSQAEAQNPNRLQACKQNLRHARQQLRQVEADLANYQAAYQELMNGLTRIERVNENRPQKARKRIRGIIGKTRTATSRYVASTPQPRPPAPPAPGPVYDPPQHHPPQGPVVIGQRAFGRLMKMIEGNAFDKERLAYIAEAARDNAFTVRQVVRLMKAMSFESTRIEVAVVLYPVVVDMDNWFQVYKGFQFDSSRRKLQKRLP